MKFIYIYCTILFCHLTALSQDNLVMEANATLRKVEEKFNKIVVSGGVKLMISQADNIAMAVSASEEKYKNEIITTVKNGTLSISSQGDYKWNGKARNQIVYLSFREIESIKATGASDIIVMGLLQLQKCNIYLAGSSKLKATLDLVALTLELREASSTKLAGNVQDLNIDCSRASDIDGYSLLAQRASISASGASDILISVSQSLNAEASSASHIYYKGDATIVQVKASGVSEIKNTN